MNAETLESPHTRSTRPARIAAPRAFHVLAAGVLLLLGTLGAPWARAESASRKDTVALLAELRAALAANRGPRPGAGSAHRKPENVLRDLLSVRPLAVEPLRAALQDPAGDVRASAVTALSGGKGTEVTDALAKALKDKDPTVRACAAIALGRIADPRSLPPLTAALKDKSWLVRSWAGDALGEIADARAVGPLVATLKADGNSWNRGVALGDVWPFVRWMRNTEKYTTTTSSCADPNGLVARAVVKLGPRAVKPLVAALRSAEEEELHGLAWTLGQIGPPAVEPLIPLLQHRSPALRASVAFALGRARDPRAVPALVAALRDKGEQVRVESVEALGAIGDARAVPALIAALKQRDSEVGCCAVVALGRIGDARALKPLIPLLTDREVRHVAAEALGRLGGHQAARALLQQIRRSAEHPPHWLIDPLIQTGPAGVDALLGAVADKNRLVRYDVLTALGQTRDPRAVASLLKALREDDDDLRWTAAAGLGEIGDSRAVRPLLAALKDKVGSVRICAARALGRIGDRRAVDDLIAALQDGASWDLGEAAAQSLGALGDPEAVRPLIAALHDEDRDVRQFVVVALGQIGDARALPALEALTKGEKDPSIQRCLRWATEGIRAGRKGRHPPGGLSRRISAPFPLNRK